MIGVIPGSNSGISVNFVVYSTFFERYTLSRSFERPTGADNCCRATSDLIFLLIFIMERFGPGFPFPIFDRPCS
jgi:hypothetical protein